MVSLSKFTYNMRQKCIPNQPQPGEIWEVSRSIHCPVEFSSEQQHQLYSDAAKQF